MGRKVTALCVSLGSKPLPEERQSTTVSLLQAQLILFSKETLLTCGIPHVPSLSQQLTLSSLSLSRSHLPLVLPQQRPVPVWIRQLNQVETEILLMVCVFGLASRYTSTPTQLTTELLKCSHWQKGDTKVASLRENSGYFKLITNPYF